MENIPFQEPRLREYLDEETPILVLQQHLQHYMATGQLPTAANPFGPQPTEDQVHPQQQIGGNVSTASYVQPTKIQCPPNTSVRPLPPVSIISDGFFHCTDWTRSRQYTVKRV